MDYSNEAHFGGEARSPEGHIPQAGMHDEPYSGPLTDLAPFDPEAHLPTEQRFSVLGDQVAVDYVPNATTEPFSEPANQSTPVEVEPAPEEDGESYADLLGEGWDDDFFFGNEAGTESNIENEQEVQSAPVAENAEVEQFAYMRDPEYQERMHNETLIKAIRDKDVRSMKKLDAYVRQAFNMGMVAEAQRMTAEIALAACFHDHMNELADGLNNLDAKNDQQNDTNEQDLNTRDDEERTRCRCSGNQTCSKCQNKKKRPILPLFSVKAA